MDYIRRIVYETMHRLRRPVMGDAVLTLDNMPASAQHMPDAQGVKEDRGLTLDLCQCMGCGLVQFDCEPVDYYRDVIRAGGFSKTMVELRRYQYKHLIDSYHLEGKEIHRSGMRPGRILKGSVGISGGGSRHRA